LITSVIAGFDHKDSTSAEIPVPDYFSDLSELSGNIRVGFLTEFSSKGISEEVIENYQKAQAVVTGLGFETQSLQFPSWQVALPCYYVIAPSEASSNLARYDGVRYGLRAEARLLSDMYLRTRTQGFGSEVKRRILLGTFALSSGYYDAYYAKACRARQVITRELQSAFERVDFILTPTTPEPAFKLGEKQDPISMYFQDYFTVAANLAGIPAISIPSGLTASGLPIGLQILSRSFEESRLFKFAFKLEKSFNFQNNRYRINNSGRRKNEK
jgi:aspartyl-tRNA(Asn)/glutamyl-tRNA(Gln) amidotransferase subunit A